MRIHIRHSFYMIMVFTVTVFICSSDASGENSPVNQIEMPVKNTASIGNASAGYPAAVKLDVQLSVTNPINTALNDEPVTSGLPIPLSYNLKNINTLRVLNAKGKPVPAQFTPLARWGGAPENKTKAIRWLLIDFLADVGAGKKATFRLADRGGAKPKIPKLKVRDRAKLVKIVTGPLKIVLNKSDGTLTFKKPRATLLGKAVGKDGANYTTVGPVKTKIVLSGPVRTSVQVKGSYQSGNKKLIDYTTYYWFYAGSGRVRIFHTVENNTPGELGASEQLTCHNIGSAKSVDVRDVSLVLSTGFTGKINFEVAGNNSSEKGSLTGNLLHYQNSSGTDSWDRFPTFRNWENLPQNTAPRMQTYVNFRGFATSLAGQALDQGDQSEGWLTLANGKNQWFAGVRDFWQNFPKTLRTSTNGNIDIGLFPDEFGPSNYAFNLRAGEHKTHDCLIAYNEKTPLAGIKGLFAKASPQWYVNSGGFGRTAMPDNTNWPEHEQYIGYQLDLSPDRTNFEDHPENLFDTIERHDIYGIFDYGDWPLDYEGLNVTPINSKYDFDQGAWQQWARSGDDRWFQIAEAADRHFADIDILHNLHTPRHWGDGIAFGHSEHDEDGFLNPHRNGNSGSTDTAYSMLGMLMCYYVTGYEKCLDSALELADSFEYRLSNDDNLRQYYQNNNGQGYALDNDYGMYNSGCRLAANCLAAAVAAYRATGEKRFFDAAWALVDWAKSSDQTYINGVTGSEDLLKPWLVNMYLLHLGEYIDMLAEFGLPDNNDAKQSYRGYADFLLNHALVNVSNIASGPRAGYPYEWFFDGRQGDPNDEESEGNNVPGINNWLLLGADAMAYAYELTNNQAYMTAAEKLFRAGIHDPWFEGDPSCYTETKQAINSIAYGHVFLNIWTKQN